MLWHFVWFCFHYNITLKKVSHLDSIFTNFVQMTDLSFISYICRLFLYILWCNSQSCHRTRQCSLRMIILQTTLFLFHSFFGSCFGFSCTDGTSWTAKEWVSSHFFKEKWADYECFYTFSHFTLCRMFRAKNPLIYKKCQNKCFTWNI